MPIIGLMTEPGTGFKPTPPHSCTSPSFGTMVQFRVGLLVLLAQTLLLLAPVRGRSLNESEILDKDAKHIQPALHDYDKDENNYDEEVLKAKGLTSDDFRDPKADDPEAEDGFRDPKADDPEADDGFRDPKIFDPKADSGFPDPEADDGFPYEKTFYPTTWNGDFDRGYRVQYIEPVGIQYLCQETSFHVTFSKTAVGDVKVIDSSSAIALTAVPNTCGYQVDTNINVAIIPFGGCYVTRTANYMVELQFTDEFAQTKNARLSCDFPRVSKTGVSHAAGDSVGTSQKCQKKPPQLSVKSDATALNCLIPTEERVTCGQHSMSASECKAMGCCADPHSSYCYYPLDECTKDQHFVFAIRKNSASVSIDLSKLSLSGSACFPVILTPEYAIFKFKVTECGTHAYTVGKTQVYLAEVQTLVQALNLKFGVITRSDPVRFLIECRYNNEESPYAMESVGYMVMTPSATTKSALPSQIVSDGNYGVQLKIANDATFNTYMPTHHAPLRLLLGKPVYLELNLNTESPDSVLVVNYCLAYPRSAKNAMVMVYEGCTNPYDKTVAIIPIGNVNINRHQRRFVVTAFQFMDQHTNKYLNEEIYFMCSTEVCRPTEKNCELRCFDGHDILLPSN